MTTKTTHTPAPWKSRDAVVLHGIEKSQDCAILDGENCIIGECFEKVGRTSEGRFLYRPSQANAAHIVRCVNEREELLGTIESLFTLFICDTLSVPAKKRTWHVEGNIQGALDNANSILARAESEG